jgi:hypothetical protein
VHEVRHQIDGLAQLDDRVADPACAHVVQG